MAENLGQELEIEGIAVNQTKGPSVTLKCDGLYIWIQLRGNKYAKSWPQSALDRHVKVRGTVAYCEAPKEPLATICPCFYLTDVVILSGQE